MNRASGRAFPLLLAALNDHEAVVEHLLTANADPNQIQKKSGAFPLLMAALNGHEAVVGRLLMAKADPNQRFTRAARSRCSSRRRQVMRLLSDACPRPRPIPTKLVNRTANRR